MLIWRRYIRDEKIFEHARGKRAIYDGHTTVIQYGGINMYEITGPVGKTATRSA